MKIPANGDWKSGQKILPENDLMQRIKYPHDKWISVNSQAIPEFSYIKPTRTTTKTSTTILIEAQPQNDPRPSITSQPIKEAPTTSEVSKVSQASSSEVNPQLTSSENAYGLEAMKSNGLKSVANEAAASTLLRGNEEPKVNQETIQSSIDEMVAKAIEGSLQEWQRYLESLPLPEKSKKNPEETVYDVNNAEEYFERQVQIFAHELEVLKGADEYKKGDQSQELNFICEECADIMKVNAQINDTSGKNDEKSKFMGEKDLLKQVEGRSDATEGESENRGTAENVTYKNVSHAMELKDGVTDNHTYAKNEHDSQWKHQNSSRSSSHERNSNTVTSEILSDIQKHPDTGYKDNALSNCTQSSATQIPKSEEISHEDDKPEKYRKVLDHNTPIPKRNLNELLLIVNCLHYYSEEVYLEEESNHKKARRPTIEDTFDEYYLKSFGPYNKYGKCKTSAENFMNKIVENTVTNMKLQIENNCKNFFKKQIQELQEDIVEMLTLTSTYTNKKWNNILFLASETLENLSQIVLYAAKCMPDAVALSRGEKASKCTNKLLLPALENLSKITDEVMEVIKNTLSAEVPHKLQRDMESLVGYTDKKMKTLKNGMREAILQTRQKLEVEADLYWRYVDYNDGQHLMKAKQRIRKAIDQCEQTIDESFQKVLARIIRTVISLREYTGTRRAWDVLEMTLMEFEQYTRFSLLEHEERIIFVVKKSEILSDKQCNHFAIKEAVDAANASYINSSRQMMYTLFRVQHRLPTCKDEDTSSPNSSEGTKHGFIRRECDSLKETFIKTFKEKKNETSNKISVTVQENTLQIDVTVDSSLEKMKAGIDRDMRDMVEKIKYIFERTEKICSHIDQIEDLLEVDNFNDMNI